VTTTHTMGSTARVLAPGDPGWPPLLTEAAHQRPVERLWVIGRDPASLGPCVAIVGARNCTMYGITFAKRLASDLARLGVCVVSGLARGIDAAAHEGALRAGGTTIAVLAGGVDKPYPMASRRLYEEISAHGAIISEKPPGESARKHHFPIRNQIIAALSWSVVVVQGELKGEGKRSGSLYTANAAADFGRTIFGVPGDVNSIVSEGPHQLIRDGADICTSAEDVLDDLEHRLGYRLGVIAEDSPLPEGLEPDERAVMEAVSRSPARAEQLAAAAGIDLVRAMRVLSGLELEGCVAREGGGVFRRAR